MRIRTLLVALSLVALVSIAGPIGAQTIRGLVQFEGRTGPFPAPGVLVLISGSGGFYAYTITDQEGMYYFRYDLPERSYAIVVSLPPKGFTLFDSWEGFSSRVAQRLHIQGDLYMLLDRNGSVIGIQRDAVSPETQRQYTDIERIVLKAEWIR